MRELARTAVTALGLLVTGATGAAAGGPPIQPDDGPGSDAQERPVVVIDAGHGGDEVGVETDGILEKDLVLRIALTVAAEFVEAGYDVRLTRDGDYAIPWDERRAMAEEEGAALLLMLHTNGDEDPSARGAEVYTYSGDETSTRAGALVSEALRRLLSQVVEEPRDWPFLQSSEVATAMIEIAFLTNPDDRRLLLSDDFHHRLGEALAGAASDLLGEDAPAGR